MDKLWQCLVFFSVCSLFITGFSPAAAANVIIVGDLTHEYEVKPGGAYSGNIVVSNVDKEAHEVKVYQTDYQFFADGKVNYGDPGKLPRSNAGWLNITPKYFTVPGNESVTVYYTIKVPDDESMRGTYWSIIMIEGITRDSPESGSPEAGAALGIGQVFRYGIQMVTHIGTTGTRSLKFTGARLIKEEKQLLLDVENTGERWLRAVLWAELYDSKGVLTGKFEAGKLRIYPGTSVRFVLKFPDIKPGKYKALVIVDCGNNDVFGANWNLVLE